jgi:hypothetical protein
VDAETLLARIVADADRARGPKQHVCVVVVTEVPDGMQLNSAHTVGWTGDTWAMILARAAHGVPGQRGGARG